MLRGDVRIEHLPTATCGFYLQGGKDWTSTCLRWAPYPDTVHIAVDTSVRQSPGFRDVAPGYYPILERASVGNRDGKIVLVPEKPDDAEKALVNLNAGLGQAEFVDYRLNGAIVVKDIDEQGHHKLVMVSPGQTIVAVRSTGRWWNFLGFKSRKTIEEIHISYDGEGISMACTAAGASKNTD
jgi:hypothetical protein